jgi:hypothetical protein
MDGDQDVTIKRFSMSAKVSCSSALSGAKNSSVAASKA